MLFVISQQFRNGKSYFGLQVVGSLVVFARWRQLHKNGRLTLGRVPRL